MNRVINNNINSSRNVVYNHSNNNNQRDRIINNNQHNDNRHVDNARVDKHAAPTFAARPAAVGSRVAHAPAPALHKPMTMPDFRTYAEHAATSYNAAPQRNAAAQRNVAAAAATHHSADAAQRHAVIPRHDAAIPLRARSPYAMHGATAAAHVRPPVRPAPKPTRAQSHPVARAQPSYQAAPFAHRVHAEHDAEPRTVPQFRQEQHASQRPAKPAQRAQAGAARPVRREDYRQAAAQEQAPRTTAVHAKRDNKHDHDH